MPYIPYRLDLYLTLVKKRVSRTLRESDLLILLLSNRVQNLVIFSLLGPPIDLPVGITTAQLTLICNALLQNVSLRLWSYSNFINFDSWFIGRTNAVLVFRQWRGGQAVAGESDWHQKTGHRSGHWYCLSTTSIVQSTCSYAMYQLDARSCWSRSLTKFQSMRATFS